MEQQRLFQYLFRWAVSNMLNQSIEFIYNIYVLARKI
jgi:hypothetical protein